ncbi:MAG: hypothetical protein F4Z34_15320, partial [Acidimicrobiaceae bacterium]|nr:hypothetical protein [Acidimicrobiaceae bacterium]
MSLIPRFLPLVSLAVAALLVVACSGGQSTDAPVTGDIAPVEEPEPVEDVEPAEEVAPVEDAVEPVEDVEPAEEVAPVEDAVEPVEVAEPVEEAATPEDMSTVDRLKRNAEQFEYSIGTPGGALAITTISEPLTFNLAISNDASS